MFRTALIKSTTPICLRSVSTCRYYSLASIATDTLDWAMLTSKKAEEEIDAASMRVRGVKPPPPDLAEDEAEFVKKVNGGKLDGADIADIVQHRHEAIEKVWDNTKGYVSLPDKGSKAESEQNRPDDGL
ncbi:uncharacterized protein J8A68_002517 [[Candida] subhashii]|uniref:Uncharacterized protein n=1 Tax=[Candida] subhashii TaxID=561895 RepID=A0A8J5QNX6_9ASCO|nr:uncharacterized protein J8A68_002517 [[Candida] subhashii]KAG7663956.1 hypothetical protein J8A68_002517 [[Candida] subhashii]